MLSFIWVLFSSGIENPNLILSTAQQVFSQQVPMLPLEVKLSTEDVFKPRPDNIKVDEFYFPPGVKMRKCTPSCCWMERNFLIFLHFLFS